MLIIGYRSASFVEAVEVSRCYALNGENYCFYSDGSSVLSWDEAREFCARRNSTLPIITDEDVDDVFQQFIRNTSVWIDARARPVDRNTSWHWIDGSQSGMPTIH